MKAKIITLAAPATVTDGDHFEPHGTTSHVAHYPHTGVTCLFSLGTAGLQYRRGEDVAAIPLAELIRLFESAHPPFALKPNGETRPEEVDELGAPKA